MTWSVQGDLGRADSTRWGGGLSRGKGKVQTLSHWTFLSFFSACVLCFFLFQLVTKFTQMNSALQTFLQPKFLFFWSLLNFLIPKVGSSGTGVHFPAVIFFSRKSPQYW